MAASRGRSRNRLDVDHIVETALDAITEDGLGRLSMRRLGARLGVDPMAVYHHIANKQELLALVMGRVVGAMAEPDESAPWPDRVRQWALGYWDVVAAHRELVAAALTDPTIAAGGMPATEPLRRAVADSGLTSDRVEANVYLVVDAVHGSALAGPSQSTGPMTSEQTRVWFEQGLETIIAGLAASSARSTPA